MMRIGEKRDPPLGHGTSLGKRQRNAVAGETDGLGMEVTAIEDVARVWVHHRVVGPTIDLGGNDRRSMAQLIKAGTHHLGLTAQAIRVLQAATGSLGIAYATFCQQRTEERCNGHLPWLAPRAMQAWVKCHDMPLRSLEAEGPGHKCRRQHVLRRKEPVHGERG